MHRDRWDHQLAGFTFGSGCGLATGTEALVRRGEGAGDRIVKVVKVALGVIQDRGITCVDPKLVAFGVAESDFLVRHVEKVRRLTETSVRGLFSPDSGMPGILKSLATAEDTVFETTAKNLQDSLADAMRPVPNARDCVFAVVVTVDPQADSHVTLLKLDAVVEAARMELLKTGGVSLKVLKELLPEPGRVQKALSWPDGRTVSDAITIDTNATSARYFEDAFDMRVSPKSTEAETALAKTLVERIPAENLPAAFTAAAVIEGPLDDVLEALTEAGFPELAEVALDVAGEERPAGIIRPNKLAAKSVVWRADGVELRVPAELASYVNIEPEGDGWRLTLRTRTRPVPGV
jgi:hypothetical protein